MRTDLSPRSDRQSFFFYISGWFRDLYGLRVFQHSARVRVRKLIQRLSSLRSQGIDKGLSRWFENRLCPAMRISVFQCCGRW